MYRIALTLLVLAIVAATSVVLTPLPSTAQNRDDDGFAPQPVFIDPNRAFEKPSDVPSSITFLTTLDFPPFNFVNADGKLTGFNVDLARAICEELQVRCQMRVLAFNRIVRGLIDGKGEAAVAGLAETERTRRRLKFTIPYLRMAGRFTANKANPVDARPGRPGTARISIAGGSAHEAFLREYFPEAEIVSYDSVAEARQALKDGTVALHFGDALSQSFWLQSEAAEECCEFHGHAFFSETHFGRGMSISVAEESESLQAVLNFALQRLVATGKFSELYLRYFPLSLY